MPKLVKFSYAVSIIGTLFVMLFGQGGTFLVNIIFARFVGIEEFGQYSYILSLITVMSLPCIAGLHQLLIREVSISVALKQAAPLKGLLYWSALFILLMSVIIITASLLYKYIFSPWEDGRLWVVLIPLLIIPIRSLNNGFAAVINGLKYPKLAQLPYKVIPPISILFLVFILVLSGQTINSHIDLLTLLLAACFISMIFSASLLFRLLPKDTLEGDAEFHSKKWLLTLIPFSSIVIITTMNKELAAILLGIFSTKESVALFTVGSQIVLLLTIGLQAVNTVIAPRIAESYKQGQHELTQKIMTEGVRISCLGIVPLVILLLLFIDKIVLLLFGSEYLESVIIVKILAIGSMVNVVFGSVGVTLNMTGNERTTLKAQFYSLIVVLILHALLTPTFGVIGAAVTVVTGMLFWNAYMSKKLYALTGLKSWLR